MGTTPSRLPLLLKYSLRQEKLVILLGKMPVHRWFVTGTPTGLEDGMIVVATTRRGVGLGALSLVLETTLVVEATVDISMS